MSNSVALSVVRNRVNNRIRNWDSGSGKNAFDVLEVDEAIASAYIRYAAFLSAPHAFSASALTISAGSTFTLPTTAVVVSGAEYAANVKIQLVSTGEFLDKISAPEMDALRNAQTTIPASRPDRFSLYVDNAGAIKGFCYPAAASAEVCNLWRALLPDDLRDAANMSAAVIYFDRLGVEALVIETAASLLARMTDADLETRRLNPNVVPLWQKEARGMLYQDAVNRAGLEGRPFRERVVR